MENSSHFNRRLAAIAFADVAGYSRLMAVDDAETVRRWSLLRTEIMEPNAAQNGGRLAQNAGDALLIEFPSAVSAVRWGAAAPDFWTTG
jgi:adenylate cyclase